MRKSIQDCCSVGFVLSTAEFFVVSFGSVLVVGVVVGVCVVCVWYVCVLSCVLFCVFGRRVGTTVFALDTET